MADRDHTTTHTTTTGTTTGARPEYRDPRTTTTTTSRRRSGTSWIGAIIAVLAIVLIAAWFVGGFEGEETAMMVGEPGVEEPIAAEGEGEAEAVIVAPVDDEPEAVAPATEEPAAPVQQ